MAYGLWPYGHLGLALPRDLALDFYLARR